MLKTCSVLILFVLSAAFGACKSSDKPAVTPIEEDIYPIKPLLAAPNSTPEAQAVYDFLRNNYGKKILSGVMTLESFDETRWLKENTGKEPAILGLDFMHNNRGYNAWFDEEQPIRDARLYWDRNGIAAVTWHWRDPSRKTEAFYTKVTGFDVQKIFEPESAEYKAMLSDIDYIADMLKKLQDQKVPIIWRPLHEAAGGWFWWGAKGAEPCKKLYQIMFDRMVNHHGLKNLIWVWTYEKDEHLWYPGDEYVDIIGRDIYKQGDRTSQKAEFSKISEHHKNARMVALSECGTVPDMTHIQADAVPWSWFMAWYGDFVRDEKHNTLTALKLIMNSSYVITLDEMPSLKK